MNFVYEIALFQSLTPKICFGKIVNICFLCVNIFTNVLEKDLEKIVPRADWLHTYLDRTSTSVFRNISIAMIEQFFQRIFMEGRMTFEFLFYETLLLSIELLIRRRIEQRNCEVIFENTKNLL